VNELSDQSEYLPLSWPKSIYTCGSLHTAAKRSSKIDKILEDEERKDLLLACVDAIRTFKFMHVHADIGWNIDMLIHPRYVFVHS
jgi:hypothetical protein